jgi:hypothetical protein
MDVDDVFLCPRGDAREAERRAALLALLTTTDWIMSMDCDLAMDIEGNARAERCMTGHAGLMEHEHGHAVQPAPRECSGDQNKTLSSADATMLGERLVGQYFVLQHPARVRIQRISSVEGQHDSESERMRASPAARAAARIRAWVQEVPLVLLPEMEQSMASVRRARLEQNPPLGYAHLVDLWEQAGSVWYTEPDGNTAGVFVLDPAIASSPASWTVLVPI